MFCMDKATNGLFSSVKSVNEKVYIYIVVPSTIIDFVKNSFELDIEYKKYF